jgi:hypothetical protein
MTVEFCFVEPVIAFGSFDTSRACIGSMKDGLAVAIRSLRAMHPVYAGARL